MASRPIHQALDGCHRTIDLIHPLGGTQVSQYDFDLFTIGAGSGGVSSSRRAASYGARVAICEFDRVGGTCVLRGCVPKKLLIYAAQFADNLEDARGYGWTVRDATFDWPVLIAHKDKELDRLNLIYRRMLHESGVQTIMGRAELIDAHTIKVGKDTYTAETILIATGGHPVMPSSVPGIEHAISSNEALSLETLPERVVIVGGGYIAVEFAGFFNAFGAQVSLVVRGDTILRRFDRNVRFALAAEISRRGVTLLTETRITGIEKEGGGYSLMTDTGDLLSADKVLYATGRAPNTQGLGLEEVGVRVDKTGAIQVDEWSCTTVPNIYAVGDVTNRLNLTPVAIAEGRALAETLYNNNPQTVSYENVPTAVFSAPPVGIVGLTESQARARCSKIDVYISSFRPMKHTLSGREERTHMKLVVDHATDVVLGCHMVGPDAPEIIQSLGIALQSGATKAQFDATIGVHPTTAEELVTMHNRQPDPCERG